MIKFLSAFIVVTIMISTMSLFSQDHRGTVLSSVDHAPIERAYVVDVDNPVIGTTTDEEGTFWLSQNRGKITKRLLVSALGHHDTLIDVAQMSDARNNMIVLRVRPWELPVVEVMSSFHSKPFIYGDPKGEIYTLSQKDKELVGVRWSGIAMGSGESGVMIVPANKHRGGRITSLSVYILPIGPFTHPFCVRFFSFSGKIRHNTIMNVSAVNASKQFRDMHRVPIRYAALEPGWNEIDLRSYDLRIPSEPFMGLFSSDRSVDTGKWPDCADCYGAMMGRYAGRVDGVCGVIRNIKENSILYASSEASPPAVVLRGEK